MKTVGRVAIVTGGGSGLGEATARALALRGANVAVLDLNAERAKAVGESLVGPDGTVGRSIGLACDVSNPEQAEAAIGAVEAAFGIPSILVNCAGIGPAARTVGKDGPHSLDMFRKTIEVNLVGTFNMIRLFAARAQNGEQMESGERGVIINTASVAAYDGQIGQAAYAASKGGIVAMTLPIARDLARAGIRVVTIAPGTFLTPMLAGLPEETQVSLGEQVPFPSRLGRPDEFADLACHIVENQMLNGETIRLDGAIRMAPR